MYDQESRLYGLRTIEFYSKMFERNLGQRGAYNYSVKLVNNYSY